MDEPDGGLWSEDEVLDALERYCPSGAVEAFQLLQMKFEPVNGEINPDRVLYTPVACADGNFMAVAFSLSPDPDEDGSWLTTWREVYGPVTREQLTELAAGVRD